jgi:hypothetical protein
VKQSARRKAVLGNLQNRQNTLERNRILPLKKIAAEGRDPIRIRNDRNEGMWQKMTNFGTRWTRGTLPAEAGFTQ